MKRRNCPMQSEKLTAGCIEADIEGTIHRYLMAVGKINVSEAFAL